MDINSTGFTPLSEHQMSRLCGGKRYVAYNDVDGDGEADLKVVVVVRNGKLKKFKRTLI